LEESERVREELADGLGFGAVGLDPVSSCIVDGDELSHAVQDGLVGLGLGSKDGCKVAPVVDEVDANGATTVGIARELVGITVDGLEVLSEWRSW